MRKCPQCNTELTQTERKLVLYCPQCNLDWHLKPEKEDCLKLAQLVFDFYRNVQR